MALSNQLKSLSTINQIKNISHQGGHTVGLSFSLNLKKKHWMFILLWSLAL